MSYLVVSPLSRISEAAVSHGAKSMISLLAEGQAFHRPGVIAASRHLHLGLNDIAVAVDTLVLPQESHVEGIIGFARRWNRVEPLLIHCWMGISRSPAAALIAALALHPEQDDTKLAQRLRAASAFVTPNRRLIAIGDALLERGGALAAAVAAIGRGRDCTEGGPFALSIGPGDGKAGSDV